MSSFFSLTTVEARFDLRPLTPEYSSLFPANGEGIRSMPLPGVKCQTCAENGQDVWVTPGLPCPNCRTAAPADRHCSHACHEDDDGQ